MKSNYLLLIVLAALACFAPTAVVDNSLEVWVDQENDKGRRWQDFLAEFGSSEFIVIAVACEEPFTARHLEMLLDLEERLEKLGEVEAVLGPGKIYRLLFPEGDIEAFREEMTLSPFYRGLLVGKDGKTLGIFVHLKKIEAKPTARREIAAAIRAEVDTAARRSDAVFYLAGPTLLNADLDTASQRSAEILTPLCVFIVLVWMALMVKSLWSGLSVLAAVGLSIGATIGTMAIAGISLNMLTTAMPGLLLVLGVATAVHIVHRAHALERDEPRDRAIAQAMRELRRPCSNASITTAVGFSSLMVSTMPAVRQFGLFTAIGLIFGLAANLILLPWFLSASWNRVRPHREFLNVPAVVLGRFGYRRRRTVTAVALLLTGYAAYLATGFEVEANTLKFLPENSRTVRDSEFIAANLTGLYSVELDLRVDDRHPIPWHWLDDFCRELEKNPAVSRVYSPTDLIKKMNAADEEDHAAYRLPEKMGYIELYIVSMPELLAEEWARRCKNNDRRMRISILIHEMRSNLYRTVFADLDRLSESAPPGVSMNTTGIISLVSDAQEELIRTQIKSFGISAAIICLMMALVLRQWRVIVAAIPGNLLPPLLSFALMVVLGIKLDAGTVIVASIAIGIAVDDTVHICQRFQLLAPDRGVRQALCDTLKITGSPIIATSLIISAGFAAMLLAPFRPLMYFGGLTMFAVLAALLCDLLWLPSLLGILMPDTRENIQRED